MVSGSFGEVFRIKSRIHRGGLDAATYDDVAEFPAALSAAWCEGNQRAFVGAAGGFHGFRWNEETQRLTAVVADPCFEPVVVVGGSEADAVVVGGEQQVPKHRQRAAEVFEASEELLGIAQGVGWDVDGGHGIVAWGSVVGMKMR
jgi:hypothetical protein